MTKLRTGDPWMPAADYGRALRGLTVNLLVESIEECLKFHTEVLGAEVVYADPDFAVCRHGAAEWMLHARHTYDAHPLAGLIDPNAPAAAYPELRLHGRDPDAAEDAAKRLGFEVVAGAADKAHGLREAYILDGCGYLWVPDVPSADD